MVITGSANLYAAATDPLAGFNARIEPATGVPEQKQIVFGPIIAGRTYTVMSSDSLTAGNWQPLGGVMIKNTPAERVIVDPSVTALRKFFRVDVSSP